MDLEQKEDKIVVRNVMQGGSVYNHGRKSIKWSILIRCFLLQNDFVILYLRTLRIKIISGFVQFEFSSSLFQRGLFKQLILNRL